ncbi:MAG: ABC transporter substrate-binding protein [Azospirillum sp.]|nr:ABC transporter substrate-binding protein [Azospirillum sp.]
MPDATTANKPRLSKRSLFLVILLGAAGLAGAISLVAYTVLEQASGQELRLAVVAPLSGPRQALGEAIRQGAELQVEQTNKAGGIAGRPLRLVAFDDGDDPDRAGQAAERAAADGAVGVIGHWSNAAAAAADRVYQARGLPAITTAGADSPAGEAGTGSPPEPWLFRNNFDRRYEIRFLANYVRNVIGEKTLSIIHAADAEHEALADDFDQVLQRFGTKVVYRWGFAPAAADFDQRLAEITADIAGKKLIGAILVLGDPTASARVIAALRAADLRNRVVGPGTLATAAFLRAFEQVWHGKASLAAALNGTLTITPLLFDTAGELAEGFRNAFINRHRVPPDWVAASAFDAARLLVHALDTGTATAAGDALPLAEQRRRIRDRLVRLDSRGESYQGLMGPVAFDARGVSAPTAQAGSFDGADLVAALTQLSAIREENVGSYLDELVAGRALYVNDRFMYKTNVVYAGLKLDKIGALDFAANTVELDFRVWFRWRGPIEPQDVVFANAVQPIQLDHPDRELTAGDLRYRAYHAKGRFFLNYSGVDRPYGNQVFGIAFRHRSLNRNNLMFVSDILGMDLNRGLTLAEQMTQANLIRDVGEAAGDASWFQRLSALLPSSVQNADPLVQAMRQGRVLAGLSGWALDRAWISQETVRRGAEGDPAFVGFGKPQPEFSQLDLGGLLKPDQVRARDLVPPRYFLAIAIFGLVGAILAAVLDFKDRGQFWRMQTLGLRIVAWPLLAIAGGNLALDHALSSFGTGAADAMVLVYNALWWLIPAQLFAISLERFLWVPLEIRAGRKIPNIVRLVAALVVYLFAFFGVVAFVLGQTITSLLATSGLLAMIIGLAIQANIANVFSGIVLNIERPFQVGDYITIGSTVMGQVVDITWRTSRIRHLDGQLVSLANGKVSEAEVHNYSDLGNFFVRLKLYLEPCHDPRLVARLVNEALASFDIFINLSSNYFRPDCQFKGVECVNGVWSAHYRVKFHLEKGNDVNMVTHEVWARVWERFQANGIAWTMPEAGERLPASGRDVLTIDHQKAAMMGAA